MTVLMYVCFFVAGFYGGMGLMAVLFVSRERDCDQEYQEHGQDCDQ